MLIPADVDQLLNQVRVELTGASEGGMRAKMFEVMSEFFNMTSAWQEGIAFASQLHVRHYHVDATEGQIIRLEGVFDAKGNFVPALMPEFGEIVLEHSLNTVQQLFAVVTKNVVLPNGRNAIPIAPDWTLRVWHLAIKHGILGQLQNEPNKSYSDKKSAQYNLARFQGFMSAARTQMLRKNTRGASAWRFPQSFRANGQQGGVPSIGGGQRTF